MWCHSHVSIVGSVGAGNICCVYLSVRLSLSLYRTTDARPDNQHCNMRDTLYLPSQGNMCESSPILMPGQQVQHPAMLGLSAFEQAEVVLTGYRDCAAEAIRYLVEEERFAMDDPLVIGLRKHLYEQQRALNIHRILSNLENNPYYDDEIDNTYLDDSGIGETSIGGNGSSMEGSTPSETDSDFLPSGNISNVTPEVDRDAIVSLAEEILSLIELGEEPEEDTDGCPPVDTDDYLMQ